MRNPARPSDVSASRKKRGEKKRKGNVTACANYASWGQIRESRDEFSRFSNSHSRRARRCQSDRERDEFQQHNRSASKPIFSRKQIPCSFSRVVRSSVKEDLVSILAKINTRRIRASIGFPIPDGNCIAFPQYP